MIGLDTNVLVRAFACVPGRKVGLARLPDRTLGGACGLQPDRDV